MLDFTKTWQRLIRINWAILAMLVAAALVIPNSAAAVTLSSALAFSALSTSGDVNINNVAKVSVNALGAVGGQNVTLGSNSLAGGDAVADPGAITLGNFSKVISKCITGGGAVNLHLGAKCGSTDTTGTNPELTVLSNAITDVGTFVTALTSATPTQTLPATIVKDFPSTTITDTVVGGLNIIELPSLILKNSSTLILSGGAADSMVLEITGNLLIGSGARILLKGGLNVDQVLIYVNGTVAAWGNTTTVGATLLAPNSACAAGSGAKVVGAIICGGNVTFLQNATLVFTPTLVDIPTTPPPPLTLGDASGFLVVSTSGDAKLGTVTLANPAAPNAGDLGGNTDTIGSNSVIQGNVVAGNNSGTGISLGNFTKAKQGCITDGSSVVLGSGASCATTDTTGTNPELGTLAGAGSDASSFAAAAAAFPVDQSLAAINIPASGTQTITCGVSGRNVVDTPSITMGGSSTLKLACSSSDIIVINVTGGGLTLGPGFKIALTGGITADRVVFNVEGLSAGPALIGGASSIFNGTLVAPARACVVKTGAAINGQLVCGSDVTIGDNLAATYVALIPIP
jgi:hypothetical protein